MYLLLTLTVIFSDPAKTKPLFIPADAFTSPQQYGLTRDFINQIDSDMTSVRETRRALGEESDCATAPAQARGDIDATGTILEIASGWDAELRIVTSLARVKLQSGEEVLVEFPFGSMRLGRTTWCTGDRQLKAGDAIAFNARRVQSTPARLIATAREVVR
ncbi:MAG TPA: hypothetical protein VII75_00690 [Thermoanaerobaculia bacterium]